MYALLYILGIAACVYLLVGSVMIFRRQRKATLDKDGGLSVAKHPVRSNPILILYLVVPVLAMIVGMIWVAWTQS